MDRTLIFEFDILHQQYEEDYKKIWFSIKDYWLYFQNCDLHMGTAITDFQKFRDMLWENLDPFSDTYIISQDTTRNPSHKIIYDWLIYNFYKEDGYIGTCRIKLEKDKILCPTLNTEANVTDDLELMIKKLKGFTKIV